MQNRCDCAVPMSCSSNLRKVSHETTKEIAQTNKTTEFDKAGGCWPVGQSRTADSFDIHGYSSVRKTNGDPGRELMSKKKSLGKKGREHLLDVGEMVFWRIGKYQNIVDKDDDELPKEGLHACSTRSIKVWKAAGAFDSPIPITFH